MRRNIQIAVCSAMVVIVGSGAMAEQIRRRPADPEKSGTSMQVSLTAGGQRYESSAAGQCTHAPTASIYGVVSELWTAQQSDNGKSLSLSLWQPKDGSKPMVSLTVSSGKSQHRVSTIKGAQIIGSAKTQFEPAGKGGMFTVYAKSAEGADIMGTIKCDAFAPHIAEGGL
jgi:hypothetical protein